VAAELVMLRRGGTGVPLKDVEQVAERFFKRQGTSDGPAAPGTNEESA
jgi:hypothetical protein